MITDHICHTACGSIRGTATQKGVTAFRGVRYAYAGRWKYPQLVTHWEGIYDATKFGPNAISRAAFQPEDPNSFYCKEFRAGLDYTYSEDCQYLNLYVPNQACKAPVIVYIHGGAFMGGSGWDKVFDSPAWPENGVIAVTLNYRLGIFGNLILPELMEEAGHAGNYHVYDQLAALQWIHDNIEAFGGDPDNITLMGQSAGARSVQMLVNSPRVYGLVHRAVMSSGGCVPSQLFDYVPTQAESLVLWEEWRTQLGGLSLDQLRTLDAETVIGSLGQFFGKKGFHTVISHISPVYDNADFPAPGTEAALPEGSLDIPYLCGGNRDDIVPGLASDAQKWTARRRTPSYSYCFARALPGDNAGAWHSADLWYWFGTMHRCWRPFEETDQRLSEMMQQYLLNFARYGDPNGEGLPNWEDSRSSGRVMLLDTNCCMTEVIPSPRVGSGSMI